MTVAIFLFGVMLGIAAATLMIYKRSIGVLRIVESDTDELPYLFLELTGNADTFKRKRYVVLKTDFNHYLSRK